jgi:hypothetical protein
MEIENTVDSEAAGKLVEDAEKDIVEEEEGDDKYPKYLDNRYIAAKAQELHTQVRYTWDKLETGIDFSMILSVIGFIIFCSCWTFIRQCCRSGQSGKMHEPFKRTERDGSKALKVGEEMHAADLEESGIAMQSLVTKEIESSGGGDKKRFGGERKIKKGENRFKNAKVEESKMDSSSDSIYSSSRRMSTEAADDLQVEPINSCRQKVYRILLQILYYCS